MVMLIDGRALAYRAYYARVNDLERGALDGFIGSMRGLWKKLQPAAWVVAWEDGGKTFRHDLFAAYKSGRRAPAGLQPQFPMIVQWCKEQGIPVVSSPAYEADDVLAGLTTYAKDDVLVVTNDKDLFQTMRPGVRVLRPGSWQSLDDAVDDFWLWREWGVRPEQVPDVLALSGDGVDAIPGVPGIGRKGACTMIAEHGNLEGLYANLDKFKSTHYTKLLAFRDGVMLARELTRLVPVPVGPRWAAAKEPQWKAA